MIWRAGTGDDTPSRATVSYHQSNMVLRKDALAVATAAACSEIVRLNAFPGAARTSSPQGWKLVPWHFTSVVERTALSNVAVAGERLRYRRPRESLSFPRAALVSTRSNLSTRMSLERGAGDDRESVGGDEAGGTNEGNDSKSEGSGDVRGQEAAGDVQEDEEKITEEELSGLYGRISAMRQREVEIDRVCAHNWRRGTCSHDLLFQAADPIQHLAWVGDQLAFGTSGGGNWIIDRTTGFVVNVFEGHSGDVTALCFDGELLVTGGSDRTVRVQRNSRDHLEDEQLGECLHVLKGHSERVTGVARLDGSRLVSCSSDSSLRVWDLKTGKVLHELGLPSPANCLGAAEGYLVSGLADGRVVAWETTGVPREILSLEAHHNGVTALSFPKQDVLLTGGGDGRVKFWDLGNGGAAVNNRYDVGGGDSVIHTFKGHPAAVCAVQGDEHRLVSAGAEGTVSIWDLRTGQELFQIYGHHGGIRSLLFDRERLITDGTGESLYLHDFTGRRGVPAVIGLDSPPGGNGKNSPSTAFWIGGSKRGDTTSDDDNRGGADGSSSSSELDEPSDSDDPGFRGR